MKEKSNCKLHERGSMNNIKINSISLKKKFVHLQVTNTLALDSMLTTINAKSTRSDTEKEHSCILIKVCHFILIHYKKNIQ